MAELARGEQGPADVDSGIDPGAMRVGIVQDGLEQSGREAQARELRQCVRGPVVGDDRNWSDDRHRDADVAAAPGESAEVVDRPGMVEEHRVGTGVLLGQHPIGPPLDGRAGRTLGDRDERAMAAGERGEAGAIHRERCGEVGAEPGRRMITGHTVDRSNARSDERVDLGAALGLAPISGCDRGHHGHTLGSDDPRCDVWPFRRRVVEVLAEQRSVAVLRELGRRVQQRHGVVHGRADVDHDGRQIERPGHPGLTDPDGNRRVEAERAGAVVDLAPSIIADATTRAVDHRLGASDATSSDGGRHGASLLCHGTAVHDPTCSARQFGYEWPVTSHATVDRTTMELFDDPSEWRTNVVVEQGLEGEERCAGASTSAAMPQLVDHLLDVLGTATPGTGLDIGGGLGPLSEWLMQRTDHRVVPVDPSEASCRGARRLFGLASVRAGASTLPFATGSCSVTVLNGVVSLLDDLGSAVAEAARTTRPDGIVAVADLTASGDRRVASGNNHFWAADDVAAALEQAGCVVEYLACCEPGIGEWASVQQAVDDEIRRRYSDAPGFEQWRDDGARLRALIDAGTIGATSIVARRTTTR